MISLCPTCNQQIAPLTLAVCLESNVATRLGREISVTPLQAVILRTLFDRHPKATPLPHLAAKLWGAAEGPQDENGTIRVMVSQLRLKLAPLSVRIVTRHKIGYRLVLDELPAIREVAA
jgi:DNA-binding response OmpR family regulator